MQKEELQQAKNYNLNTTNADHDKRDTDNKKDKKIKKIQASHKSFPEEMN